MQPASQTASLKPAKPLTQHFRNAVILPSIAVLVLMYLYGIVMSRYYPDPFLTSPGEISLTLYSAVLYCLMVIALSLPIFLNHKPCIHQRPLFSGLAWMALPIAGMLAVVIGTFVSGMPSDGQLWGALLFLLILNLPFGIGLVWSFLQFRRELAALPA